MLETIRQFGEEQLVAGGKATEVRAAHARYFAGKEADILGLWDSPRQRDAYSWFRVHLANLRTAFRWAADQGDLDTAATIATYATFLGGLVENYESAAWAEELIEPARAVPRAHVLPPAVDHGHHGRTARPLREHPDDRGFHERKVAREQHQPAR